MDFPELIELFAANTVADIGAVSAYVKLCHRNVENIQFQIQRDKVEVAKKILEKLLENQPSKKAEVRQSLVKLQAQRSMDFDIYLALIVAGYKPNWSSEQQAFFEREVPRIRGGNDFFLSFTNRGPTVGDKRINRRYWYFIARVIGSDNITPDDRRKKNLLAKALFAKLCDASLKGFYYPRQENDNAIVEEKLLSQLRSSRVFVQLVENAMFDPPPPEEGPNYCEVEYNEAMLCIQVEDQILFAVAEECFDDLVKSELVHAPYRSWVEHIRRKSPPYLPPAEVYDIRRIELIRNNVEDVVSRVKAARWNAFDRIPG